MFKENHSQKKPLLKAKLIFSHLPDYANFLLNTQLNAITITSLQVTREEKIPLLKYFHSLTEEELIKLTSAGTKELLEHLAQNKAREYIDLNIQKWITNRLPLMQAEDVVSEDIIGVSFVRRKLFRDFLSKYTSDFAMFTTIMEEVDRFISFQEELSFDILFKLNQQKTNEHLYFIEKINNTLPGNIYVFDLVDKKEIYSNYKNGALEFTENGITEMDDQIHQRILHQKDVPRMDEHYEQFASSDDGDIRTIEYKVKSGKGNYKWLRSYETVFKRAVDGSPIQVIGIALDISNEKQVISQLKHRDQQLQEAQEISGLGIFEWDLVGNSSVFSPQLMKTFELEEKGTIPDFMENVNIADREILKDAIANSMKDDGHYECQYRYKKNMHEKVIWSRGLVSFVDDKPVKMTGFAMDVTKNHLLNEQLIQKNIELERMNKELTSFSYIAGHDLKEPLRKIRTYSNFILEKNSNDIPEETLDYLQRIISSAANMQRLIDDLLAFSRTTSSEKTFKTVDLNSLLKDVKISLKETLEEKNVVLTSSQLPTLKLIPFQFYQLLENIINNAIKYSRPNIDPRISITTGLVSGKDYITHGSNPEKIYHKISIADNGIGFEQQYAEKIFELFQRLHGKDEYSGTGIGLSICKKIVENHNGFITAEGKEGQGSTFNIFIPVE